MLRQYFFKSKFRKPSSMFDELEPDVAVRLVLNDAKLPAHFNDGEVQAKSNKMSKLPDYQFWLTQQESKPSRQVNQQPWLDEM